MVISRTDETINDYYVNDEILPEKIASTLRQLADEVENCNRHLELIDILEKPLAEIMEAVRFDDFNLNI